MKFTRAAAAAIWATLLIAGAATAQQTTYPQSFDGGRKLIESTPTAAPSMLQDECGVQVCLAIDEKLAFTSSQYSKMNVLLTQFTDGILAESTSGPTTPTGPDVVGQQNPQYFPRKLGIKACSDYLATANPSKPKAILFFTDGLTSSENTAAKSAADAARAAGIDVVVIGIKTSASQSDASLNPQLLATIASPNGVFIVVLGANNSATITAAAKRIVDTACPVGCGFPVNGDSCSSIRVCNSDTCPQQPSTKYCFRSADNHVRSYCSGALYCTDYQSCSRDAECPLMHVCIETCCGNICVPQNSCRF